MASQSKEENVLKIILENSPLKEWHFESLVKEAKITRAVANKWLKKYVKDGLLKKVKQKGKFPYFTVSSNNTIYYSLKRLYALEQIYKSGLIQQLLSLEKARTIIIFGSMVKGDWYKDSDIDVFIYGSADGLNKNLYEAKLNKKIELHIFKDKKDIKEVKTGLIRNVVNGYLVKGQIQDFAELTYEK